MLYSMLWRNHDLQVNVYDGINSTQIYLIPKIPKPATFSDIKPISLCNLIYKVISKVIARRIKPMLSRCIQREQFGILQNRQIHDAVGVAQEALHNIKKKGLYAMALKLDIVKAYDIVDWGVLILILLQNGLDLASMNWIMACVESTNHVVMTNGFHTNSFSGTRGIRQGYPLSPLLFLIIIEGLSRLIESSKECSDIVDINILTTIIITHMIFVDDVMIFGVTQLGE